MKMSRIKKRVAAMMMVSVLSLWFALTNVAHARTVTIEGRNINTSILVTASSATATISYTEGPGQVYAKVEGEAKSNIFPDMIKRNVQGPRNTNPTPGGVSSSVAAPDGWNFYAANAVYEFKVDINGTTHEGNFWERETL